MPAPDHRRQARHRALASPTRARILDLLAERPSGQDAAPLAAALSLHINTVRSHLGVLEQAGLITSSPEERHVRGRPRVIYRAIDDVDPHADGYRLLAGVLAGTLAAGSDDPGVVAERAGLGLGEQLAAGAPGEMSDAEGGVFERTVALFDDLGFAPRRDPEDPARIELHACPFRELAADHTEVVCGVHRGILKGALSEGGASTERVELSPFVTSTMCIARLA